MAINPTSAINAYTQAAKAAGGSIAGDDAQQTQAPGSEFASMVKGAIQETQDLGREAEKQSLQAIAGKASMVDVATAVNNAEMTLTTLTTVRDRMVEAYKKIMQMRI